MQDLQLTFARLTPRVGRGFDVIELEFDNRTRYYRATISPFNLLC